MQWSRAAIVFTLSLLMFSARPALAQQDSLGFFKNYFVTGGYAVGGVGLATQGVGGIAQGNIYIEGVPDGAEIAAAFLYAQVVSADDAEAAGAGVTFHDVPLTTPDGSFGVIADPLGATPCWRPSWSGGSKRTYSYRYDVLRFLPVVNGRHQANGFHPVGLPDSGKTKKAPIGLAASLVVIYRDPDMPLSAIVLYDGLWAMDNSTQGMTQAIEGFYDPAPVPGELTHIVGSGQASKSENLRVSVNGIDAVSVVNPFRGLQGKAWDNITLQTPAITADDSLTTSVDTLGTPFDDDDDDGGGGPDCLTWSAVIYRTEVNDTDLDGLLDRWETVSGLTDPNGVTLPDLAAMGSDPLHKDIFLEAGYMYADGDPATPELDGVVSYGPDAKPAHSHLPSAAAIQKVVDAFAAAPVANPGSSNGINVHFDVGDNHQGVPGVIPSALARGGEFLDEMVTVCQRAPDDPPYVCQFSAYPGTVAWKSSYRAFRDALLNDPDPDAPPEGDHVCDTPVNAGYDDGPGGNCERVFDRNRKDMFRYVLFAHFVGVPKAHCLDLVEFDPLTGDPNPNFGLPDAICQATNPLFQVPNTYTGIGDWGGVLRPRVFLDT